MHTTNLHAAPTHAAPIVCFAHSLVSHWLPSSALSLLTLLTPHGLEFASPFGLASWAWLVSQLAGHGYLAGNLGMAG